MNFQVEKDSGIIPQILTQILDSFIKELCFPIRIRRITP